MAFDTRRLPRILAALLAFFAIPETAIACAPLPPALEAGFYRDGITHLPRNARGVMFLAKSIKPDVSDFLITSADDTRPLELKIHAMPGGDEIRLEPIGGFAANARYTFQYLPAHKKWRHRDRVSVTIDAAAVDTAGTYAIELAPRPEVRMIMVPGSPACKEPAIALMQPFSYRVPESLASYRDDMEYRTIVRSEPLSKSDLALAGLRAQLTSYHARYLRRSRYPVDDAYTASDDAVTAACDQQQLRGELSGTVAFPELEDKENGVGNLPVDLSRDTSGECRPLDALNHTMQAIGAEKALEQFCGRGVIYHRYRSDGAASNAEWQPEVNMSLDLAPTCTFLALESAARTHHIAPDRKTMGRLGAALAQALQRSRAHALSNRLAGVNKSMLRQSIDGLDHLIRGLPADLQSNASPMLDALLPAFIAELAEQTPYRPDTLAALIIRAGALSKEARSRLLSIARSQAMGAPHASAILAAHPPQ